MLLVLNRVFYDILAVNNVYLVITMSDYEQSRLFQAPEESCKISYRFPDSEQSFIGECLDISSAVIIFRGEHLLENGLAIELAVVSRNALTTPFKAYVEVVSSKKTGVEQYEVTTEIKGIREY